MKLERRGDTSGIGGFTEKKEENRGEKYSRKREISVIIYTGILFAVALGLIALSVAMQHRTNSTLNDITEQHRQFSAQAMENIDKLQDENELLEKKLEAAEVLTDLLDCRDEARRQEILEKMEPLLQYLDEPYLEIYNSVINNAETE